MIRSFKDAGTEDVFNDMNSPAARRTCPETIWRVARRKLNQLDSVAELRLLNVPPANRLEALKGDRDGQHSIRINNQYRVAFTWANDGAENVEIVNYH